MSLPLNESEEAGPTAGPVDISSLDLYQLLDLVIMLLSQQARRYLGLSAGFHTNELQKDPVKAHLAIDCIISLVDKMETHIPVEDKDRLRNLITELQLKYVQQIK